MNENIDLTKILDGCPIGTIFYSTIFGKVSLMGVHNNADLPIVIITGQGLIGLTSDGRYFSQYDGECTLFPSKDQRDWSKFERFWDKPKTERFDPMTWKSGDKVLFRLGETTLWKFGLFSHMFSDDFGQEIVCTTNGLYLICIPYNDDTKHLHDTTDDCPEYYKWWEE